MSSHAPDAGPRLTPAAVQAVLVLAVVLMIAGVVMIFTDVSTGLAIPVTAIGIALTAFVKLDARRDRHA